MLQLLKTRWELLAVLILFTVAKIPALHYPFYIDESWSYAPAVKLMYLHGPSLMPNAIDLFYSRGHPLLFYAMAAIWMKVFGTAHIAQHSFSLFISLLLIISVYEVTLRLFGKKTALLTLLLIPMQVIFFVQSTMLLPEVMIALLSLVTLYCYASGRYFYTFLSCSALLLTKESGMVLGLVLGVHATACLLNRQQPWNHRIRSFVSLCSAGIVIGIFYLVQKHINGWYLFPEHIGMIDWSRDAFWNKLRFSLEVIFYQDCRIRLCQVLLLLAVAAAVKRKNIRYAAPLLPACLMYAIIEQRLSFIPHLVLLATLLLTLTYTVYQLVNLPGFPAIVTRRFIYIGAAFFMSYLLFSCINFFTARYLCCILVIAFILIAACIMLYIRVLHDSFFYPAIACVILIGYCGFKYDTGIKDINLGAYDAMTVQENVVSYMEQNHLYDKDIFASFNNIQHLTKPYTGFLHTDSVFRNVGYETNANTEYFILDNIDSVMQYNEIKNNKTYQQVYTTTKGQAWAEVYRK